MTFGGAVMFTMLHSTLLKILNSLSKLILSSAIRTRKVKKRSLKEVGCLLPSGIEFIHIHMAQIIAVVTIAATSIL